MFEWNKYFPFHNQFSKEALKKADPKEVETYVNRVMESVFGSDYAAQFPFRDPLPQKEQPAKPDVKPDIDIFETADHVFVKVLNQRRMAGTSENQTHISRIMVGKLPKSRSSEKSKPSLFSQTQRNKSRL